MGPCVSWLQVHAEPRASLAWLPTTALAASAYRLTVEPQGHTFVLNIQVMRGAGALMD